MKPALKRLALVAAAPVLLAGFAIGCTIVSVAQVVHIILVSPAVYVATGKTLLIPEDMVDFWLKRENTSVRPTQAQRGEDPTTVAGPSL
jgi:hypothetical protein